VSSIAERLEQAIENDDILSICLLGHTENLDDVRLPSKDLGFPVELYPFEKAFLRSKGNVLDAMLGIDLPVRVRMPVIRSITMATFVQKFFLKRTRLDAIWLLEDLVRANNHKELQHIFDDFEKHKVVLENPPSILGQSLSLKQYKVSEILIRHKMGLNVMYSERTPLQWAIHNRNKVISEALIVSGAYVSLTGQEDDPPLIMAIRNDMQEVAKLLILHGADINTVTKYDFSPLYFAKEQEMTEIVELLEERNAKYITPEF